MIDPLSLSLFHWLTLFRFLYFIDWPCVAFYVIDWPCVAFFISVIDPVSLSLFRPMDIIQNVPSLLQFRYCFFGLYCWSSNTYYKLLHDLGLCNTYIDRVVNWIILALGTYLFKVLNVMSIQVIALTWMCFIAHPSVWQCWLWSLDLSFYQYHCYSNASVSTEALNVHVGLRVFDMYTY